MCAPYTPVETPHLPLAVRLPRGVYLGSDNISALSWLL